MNLDEPQKRKVSEWIEQGLKLSEIQSRMASELGLKVTYMEVRFLIDDLKLKLKDVEPPKEATPTIGKGAPTAASQTAAPGPMPDEVGEVEEELPAPTGKTNVSVTVDQLTRPGALISGKVTFSDGAIAEWYLDQTGRLGVAPKTQGYRPSQEDVMAFQTQLQTELARMGL